MMRSRFSEEQIIGMKEHEAGVSVADLRGMKMLEDENTRLTELLTDALLDIATLKEVLGRKVVTPAHDGRHITGAFDYHWAYGGLLRTRWVGISSWTTARRDAAQERRETKQAVRSDNRKSSGSAAV